MNKYSYHEYADLFPLIDGQAFEDLKEDIKKNGLLVPIYLYEGKILDGRNRFKACSELGITPRIENYNGEAPLDFVISMNLKRRHLNESQKAAISLAALPLFEKEAKKRQVRKPADSVTALMREQSEGEAAEKAAVLFDVSPRYIQLAKKLQREHPELLEEVKKGNTTLTKLQRSFLPPPEKDFANQMSIRRISELIEQKRLFCPKCKKHELVWKCCGEKIETTLEKIIEKQKKIVRR